MAIFYIDLVNGNDSNSGVDWANAWKTFQLGATAARIAPGDEIRCAKSPDPELVGSATWQRVVTGDDVVFGTAPTKFIADGTSGWTTMGAGTVTNNQSTAWVIGRAAQGGGLQIATSTATNLMYKALGSAQDFSAHQQVSFWIRFATAQDYSGAQDMYINLCSDTAGSTVVDQLPLPKWSYAVNQWYPIVINKGSALGSSIQSISITRTNTTSVTIYFDEFFASPADGLTLWSLLGKHTANTGEQYDWYPIKAIKDDIVTVATTGMQMSTAAGCVNSTSYQWKQEICASPETVNTYKMETLKPFPTSSIGPSSTSAALVLNDSGTFTGGIYTPIVYKGGWDTTTTTQTGMTYIDGIVNTLSGNSGVVGTSRSYNEVENVGIVRCETGLNSANTPLIFRNCSAHGCGGTPYYSGRASGSWSSLQTSSITQIDYSIRSLVGNNGPNTFGSLDSNFSRFNASYGNISSANVSYSFDSKMSFGSFPLTFNKFIWSTGNVPLTFSNFNEQFVTIPMVGSGGSAINPTGFIDTGKITITTSTKSVFDIGVTHNIQVNGSSCESTTCLIGEFRGSGVGVIKLAYGAPFFKISTWSGRTDKFYSDATSLSNVKTSVQIGDNIFVGCSSAEAQKHSVFSLDGINVHTPGSKSWKLETVSNTINKLPCNQSMKLGSAACEANKLVTVTCYVNTNTLDNDFGIRVPVLAQVPGYTVDRIAIATTTGSWEQLTITFTPTANCVFDVEAYVKLKSTTATTGYWDDLTISQAA